MTHADPAARHGCAAFAVHAVAALLIVTLAWSGATTPITPLAIASWTLAALLTAVEAAALYTGRDKTTD